MIFRQDSSDNYHICKVICPRKAISKHKFSTLQTQNRTRIGLRGFGGFFTEDFLQKYFYVLLSGAVRSLYGVVKGQVYRKITLRLRSSLALVAPLRAYLKQMQDVNKNIGVIHPIREIRDKKGNQDNMYGRESTKKPSPGVSGEGFFVKMFKS